MIWVTPVCGRYPHFYHFVLEAPAFRDPEVVAGETGVAGVRGRMFRPVFVAPPVDW